MPERSSPAVVSTIYGSVYPAVWNFQLALRSRGLASVLTTAHLFYADEIKEILHLPESFVQICMIPIAYSIGTEFKPAKRRPIDEVVRWNTWLDGFDPVQQ
jgi:nitroreductase